MAAKKKQLEKVPFIPYRDSKGRIRNAYRITPENQEKIYKNQSIDIKPIFTKEVRKKKTKVIDGKTKIYFETTIKYVDEKGKKASATDYAQFNYLREINPQNKQVVRTFQQQDFAIFSTLKNAVNEGKTVTFKNKTYEPANLYQFIKALRADMGANAKKKEYPIYKIQQQENGNLIIDEISEEEEEEEEE